MRTSPIYVERKPLLLTADEKRVIARLFVPGGEERIRLILNRVLSLSGTEVSKLYKKVVNGFSHRHKNIDTVFQHHFDEVAGYRYEDGCAGDAGPTSPPLGNLLP